MMAETDDVDGGQDETERDEVREESKSLGLERWVQFAFVALAGVVFFLADKLIGYVWDIFAEPIGPVVTAAAAVVGIMTGFFTYRASAIKDRADEVAGELAKVAWPSRRETWYSTIVVIIASIIAAVFVGIFDGMWSAVTDLIYTTS